MPTLPVRASSRLALLALLALGLPARVLAADPPEVTAGDGSAVTVLLILLLGSLTAGLFFASPLRRRFARGSFTSTRVPTRMTARFTDSPAAAQLERMAATVHARLAHVSARWPVLRTRTPLPPMLGGDIFFDDEDQAPGQPASPAAASSALASAPLVTPWSTAPISADERYLPQP